MKYSIKVLFVTVCFTVSVIVFQLTLGIHADLTQGAVQQEVVSALRADLNENLQAEAILRAEIREVYRLLSRPHSEYLLYQKSLGLKERNIDLRRLGDDRAVLLQKLALLSGEKSQPVLLSFGKGLSLSGSILLPYSGSPMLSFDGGSRSESNFLSKPSPGMTEFFRFLIVGFLCVTYSLPLAVLYKKMTEGRRTKKRVWVFPIFTVRVKNGDRRLFNIPEDDYFRVQSSGMR